MRSQVNASRVTELNRRFHDEVEAQIYDERMGVSFEQSAVIRTISELEAVLGRELPKKGVVIDVGSGTGHVAIKLALGAQFERVIAVDISTGMLERARATAELHGCSIETVETDMARLPFADNSVDLVVGCAILHHLPDPPAFMSEVLRVLRPGASCIFIGEPSKWGGRLVGTLKLPLIVANRLYRAITRRRDHEWEHNNIDVHTFAVNDINHMTKDFTDVRVVAEGFAEPLLNEIFFTPASLLLGNVPGTKGVIGAIRSGVRSADNTIFNRVVPKNFRAGLKFSASKPVKHSLGV